MFRRNLVFAIIFGFLLTFPMHGTALDDDPCYKLARGLRLLGAEDIFYRGYYFISAVEREPLARQLESMPVSLDKFPVNWHLGSGLDESYAVLRVSGEDYQLCRLFADSLAAVQGSGLLGQTWHMESYLRGREEEELADLGLHLVQLLDGKLHSVRLYDSTVYLLAYVSSFPGDVLVLDDGPVNLNLELLFEPESGSVRLCIGTPFLLTLSHFED